MTTPPKHILGQDSGELERRVANLYDFSLDIARYQSDIEFSGTDGIIHYVFDENICELFIQAFDNYPYVMREQEVRKAKPKDASKRHLIAMQSALLTAEALFNNELPGQASRRIYITEWHRWEFLERVGFLLAEFVKPSPELREAAARTLKAKQNLLSVKSTIEEYRDADPYLGLDLAHLEDFLNVNKSASHRFARARCTTAILSQDQHIEPLRQLRRLLKIYNEGALEDVTKIFSPRPRDLFEIQNATREWTKLLQRELASKAARLQTTQRKKSGAIRNDAKSLALVSWISQQLDQTKERIVLVTGDMSLFDTYRRAYEDNSDKRKSPTEPFLVRRPLQYSTLFSAKQQHKEPVHEKLFYSLQQIVELPLTPIRLGAVSDQKTSEELLYRRHSLTLNRLDQKADRTSYFHDAWLAHGGAYSDSKINDVEEQIDENERILNGLSDYLLMGRITEDERRLFAQIAEEGAGEQDRLISEYVDKIVEDMIQAAVKTWKPIAETYFRKTLVQDFAGNGRRVPLAIHAKPNDENPSNLSQLLVAILNTANGQPRSVGHISSSFEIFVGAAALALHANQWRLADHFCEVAINAFKYFSKHEGTSNEDAAEAHYLGALAKRFRLGQIVIRENRTAYLASSKLFDDAVELLRSSENLAGDVGYSFASYRSYSERAALCLFYATTCHVQAELLHGIEGAEEIATASVQAFYQAGDCLLEAIRVEHRGHFGDLPPRIDGSHGDLIKSQILINIAAWFAFSPAILRSAPNKDYSNLAREGIRGLSALESALPASRSALFQAEIFAFKISQGVNAIDNKKALSELLNFENDAILEVDKNFFSMLRKIWIDR